MFPLVSGGLREEMRHSLYFTGPMTSPKGPMNSAVSVYSSISPSFSRLNHYIFLIFCMKLGFINTSQWWSPSSEKNSWFARNRLMHNFRPKIIIFNFSPNLHIGFFWYKCCKHYKTGKGDSFWFLRELLTMPKMVEMNHLCA